MKYLFTGFTAIVLFLFSFTPVPAQNKDSLEGDREALIDLYSSTNGDNWSNNSGWLNGNPSNDWYGVEVNGDGRVIKLDLYKNNLSGELPETIGNLREIRFFSVKRNPIYSIIPLSVENWVNAKTLMFSSGSDYNLPREGTYNNHLGKTYKRSVAKYHGTIPDVFDKMPNLEILEIAWSENFDGQPFPSTLYQHSKLKVLVLQAVKLTGTLNDSFDLPNLKLLVLGNNFLSGELPSTLGQSTELVKLFFSHSNWFYKNHATNFFTGSIPASFTNLVKLQRFLIGNQNLGGEIPGFVIENWSLREFKIANNNFTGEIPKEFGDRNLVIFDVKDNNFTGKLHPRLVSGMQNVIIFNVSRNNLSGEIPNGEMIDGEFKGWRTKTGLRSVFFNDNNFSGRLPDMPEYVGDMSHLFFRHNNFTGSIPDTWKELFTPALRDENPNRVFYNFNLRDNDLQGVIPSWFTSENGPTYDVGGNRWSHRDILENGVDVGLNYLEYSTNAPKPFGKAVSQQIPEGGQFSYDYSHKVHSSDEVQWTKNGILIPGATSPVLTIESVSSSDEGLYRLELTNNNGVSYSGTRTVVSMPIELKIGEAESVPTTPSSISSPADGSVGVAVSPTIEWNSVSSALSYRLQISTDSNFSNLVVNQSNISSTQRAIMDLEYETTYYWRLRAVNSKGESSWSQSWSFTTDSDGSDEGGNSMPDAPIQAFPASGEENVTLKPSFKWSSVEAVDYYILHVSRQNPTGMAIDVIVEDTTYTPDEILGDSAVHDWRVRGVRNGEMGNWSEIRSFTTSDQGLPEVAELVSPVHFSQGVNKRAQLEWENTGAEMYRVRMRIKQEVDYIFTDETNIPIYSPDEALSDTTQYEWQVKTLENGTEGAWGPIWEFTTGDYDYIVEAPSLIAPRQGSAYDNLTPRFEWEPVDADHYIISVSKEVPSQAKSVSGESNESVVIFDETNETIYIPETTLEPGTVYYWRVQGVKENEQGEWSEVWEFTTPGTNVSNEQGEEPLQTKLSQNYPNPFNPTTQIEFTLDEMKRVSLTVYDMAGREVAVLVDEILNAGSHKKRFNADQLSSGVYFYRLISNNQSYTKKMTLIK